MDPENRKKLKAWKVAEQRARAQRMPLSPEQLGALVEHVGAQLEQSGCDGTPKHVLAWLRERHLETEAVRAALVNEGGGCDCEVVMNVEPDVIFAQPSAESAPHPDRAKPTARKAARKVGPDPVYRDDAFPLTLPGKPWRLVAPSDESVRLDLVLGKGSSVPHLRVLVPRQQLDHGWCRSRGIALLAAKWDAVARRVGFDAAAEAEQDWVKFGMKIDGPRPHTVGAFSGSMFVASSGRFMPYFVWWQPETAPWARIIELETEAGRWSNDWREANKVLASATPHPTS